MGSPKIDLSSASQPSSSTMNLGILHVRTPASVTSSHSFQQVAGASLLSRTLQRSPLPLRHRSSFRSRSRSPSPLRPTTDLPPPPIQIARRLRRVTRHAMQRSHTLRAVLLNFLNQLTHIHTCHASPSVVALFCMPAVRLFMHFGSSLTRLVWLFFFSDRRFDSEPSRLVKANTTRTGAETQHWTSERSHAQDSPPPLQTLAYRRKSDSSSAVSSTSALFCRQPMMGSLWAIHHRFCCSPLTHLRLCPEPSSPLHDLLHLPRWKGCQVIIELTYFLSMVLGDVTRRGHRLIGDKSGWRWQKWFSSLVVESLVLGPHSRILWPSPCQIVTRPKSMKRTRSECVSVDLRCLEAEYCAISVQNQMLDLLEQWLRHKSDISHPTSVATCNVDLENIILDSNRSLATNSIALLKVTILNLCFRELTEIFS